MTFFCKKITAKLHQTQSNQFCIHSLVLKNKEYPWPLLSLCFVFLPPLLFRTASLPGMLLIHNLFSLLCHILSEIRCQKKNAVCAAGQEINFWMHQAQPFAMGVSESLSNTSLERWLISHTREGALSTSRRSLRGLPEWCTAGMKGHTRLFVGITVFQFPFYYVWRFIWADTISSILLLKVRENFLSTGFCLRCTLVFNTYYLGRLASPGDKDISDQVKGMLSSLLLIISFFFNWKYIGTILWTNN